MFKRIWAILLALSLCFILAGCAGNTADESGTDVETENSTESDLGTAKDSDSIIGTWRVENVLETGTSTLDYTFRDDGTFTLYETFASGQPGEGVAETAANESGTGDGTYTTDGDKLTLHYEKISSEGITYEGHRLSADLQGSDTEFTYKIEGDSLTLTGSDGKSETLVRQATETAQDQAQDTQGESSAPSNE